MSDTIATNDGTQIYYKNWGRRAAVLCFSRGCRPLVRGTAKDKPGDALPRFTAYRDDGARLPWPTASSAALGHATICGHSAHHTREEVTVMFVSCGRTRVGDRLGRGALC